MRFAPIATTKESYQNDWRIDQGFGAVTTYGRHEGVDLNLKTGGDTDLGQPLYAIANGQITYYHFAGHPTTGFGRHIVIKIEGPWGTRWCMYSHCSDQDFLNATQSVTEGQMIARLGKSGNSPTAHLHFSIWKVDPASNGGIDSIAHNDSELNSKWEDPIAFINTWTQPVPAPQPVITDPSTKLDFQNLVTPMENYGIIDFGTVKSKIIAKDNRIKDLETKIVNAKNALG